MLLILEIAMLFGGGYALITGKMPTFLFGGPGYEVPAPSARIIGLLIALPLPVAVTLGFGLGLLNAMGLLSRSAMVLIAALGEWALVIGAAIVAAIAVRKVRKPRMVVNETGEMVPAALDVEKDIARKVDGSTVYLILGVLGPVSFVTMPLIVARTTRALRLIDEQHVGERYRSKARTVRILSIIVFGLWVAATLCFFGSLFLAK
jgi:hypothetical protein